MTEPELDEYLEYIDQCEKLERSRYKRRRETYVSIRANELRDILTESFDLQEDADELREQIRTLQRALHRKMGVESPDDLLEQSGLPKKTKRLIVKSELSDVLEEV